MEMRRRLGEGAAEPFIQLGRRFTRLQLRAGKAREYKDTTPYPHDRARPEVSQAQADEQQEERAEHAQDPRDHRGVEPAELVLVGTDGLVAGARVLRTSRRLDHGRRHRLDRRGDRAVVVGEAEAVLGGGTRYRVVNAVIGRLERDPAVTREVALHPDVGVLVADDLLVPDVVITSRAKPVDEARRDAQ